MISMPETPLPSPSEEPNAAGVSGPHSTDATGSLSSLDMTEGVLLRQMIDGGLVAIDQLGIGLAVDGASKAGDGVWALGPLTKGEFWEIVAVPDIRGQAAAVANDIFKELRDAQS